MQYIEEPTPVYSMLSTYTLFIIKLTMVLDFSGNFDEELPEACLYDRLWYAHISSNVISYN